VAFLLASFVVVQGCAEFARIAGIGRRYAYLLILWGELGLLVAALARDFFDFLPFGFFIALTLVPILSGQITESFHQLPLLPTCRARSRVAVVSNSTPSEAASSA
jgi:hypothetical protein